jgi:hypothetical protein
MYRGSSRHFKADSVDADRFRPEKQLIAGLTEIDSDITMEYGLILPHPGGEPEWFAANAVALDGIQGTGL